jgi:L-amino acid N-acyltransferase YncA
MVAAARPATQTDAPAIAEIYNQGIRGGLATFETAPRSASDIAAWLARGDLVFVAQDGDGVAGFASASQYRPRQCYESVREFSVYVRESERGKGHGSSLMQALISECRARGY